MKIIASLILAGALTTPTAYAAPSVCPYGAEIYLVTGYSRWDFGDFTADGTPILTPEPIAAGSYNLALGSYVYVEDLGIFRIADRGYLGTRHVDIATWSRDEAFALTGYRCVIEIGS